MRGQKNLLSRRDGKISLTKAHFQTGFQMKRRQILQFDGSAALSPSLVHAQDKYPSKAITWVCPYAHRHGQLCALGREPCLVQK